MESLKTVRNDSIKKTFVSISQLLIVILSLSFAISSYLNIKLISGNKILVKHLIVTLQESSIAKHKLKEINKNNEVLQSKNQALQLFIKILETQEEIKNKNHSF